MFPQSCNKTLVENGLNGHPKKLWGQVTYEATDPEIEICWSRGQVLMENPCPQSVLL